MNTKFGGLLRRYKENVLTNMKSQLHTNTIVFGGNVHIIHNWAKTAFDSMPADNEVPVTKIFVYFHVDTVHVECLKDFCDFTEEAYKQRVGHVNVRRLSLLPALQRILKIYPSLKSFFCQKQ
jgi:hypothetical protein